MRIKIFIVSILLCITPLYFVTAGENGGYAGSFLRMGAGARSNALGNAGAADHPSGYSFYYNPSAAAFIDGKIIALSYSFMSLDRRFNVVSYSMHVPPAAGLSIALINTGVGDITSYNALGEEDGSIEQWANGFYFNFARRFGNYLSVGLSIKYVREDINHRDYDYNASGWGFDFGFMYMLTEDVVLGAAIRDVRSQLKANTTNIFSETGGTTIDDFPVIYNAGLRYNTPYPWLRLMYDFEWSDKKAYKNHVGLEAVYNKENSDALGDNLAFRIGLNQSEFAAGAGMIFNFLGNTSRLDYAFLPSTIDEGSSHIFSWQFFIK